MIKKERTKNFKRARKIRAMVVGLYVVGGLTFTASVCGTCTYAWYFYESRTGFGYEGTAVGDLEELQIGLCSKVQIPSLELDKNRFTTDYMLQNDYGYIIYWSNSGGLTAETINKVSRANGYAAEKLGPVTTGKYTADDEFILHNGPTAGSNYIPGMPNYKDEQDEVDKERYSRMIFAFKSDTNQSNMPIYMTVQDFNTEEVDVRKALRFYIGNKLEGWDRSDHIFKEYNSSGVLYAPMIGEDGSTKVGGPLNLGSTKKYDCYQDETDLNVYEVAYGEFLNDPVYKKVPNNYVPTIADRYITTFDANHSIGTYYLDMNETIPAVAEFKGGNALNFHKQKVCETDPEHNNCAFFDLLIYVEGWDLTVIDATDLTSFSLDLTFTTN